MLLLTTAVIVSIVVAFAAHERNYSNYAELLHDYPTDAPRAAYGGNTQSSISSKDGVTILHDPADVTTGMVWPAFDVTNSFKYFIEVSAYTTEASASGFYLRIEESDEGNGGDFISRDPYPGMDEASRGRDLVANSPLGSSLTHFVAEYHPTPRTQRASPLIMNWSGIGAYPLTVSPVKVYAVKKGFLDAATEFNIIDVYPPRRGFYPRDAIWLDTVSNVTPITLLFGNGVETSPQFRASNGRLYDHRHGILLSTFFYGGLLAVTLLIVLVMKVSKRLANAPDGFAADTGLLVLTFFLLAYLVDGDQILAKINHVWLVMWLPVAISITCSDAQAIHR